MNKVFFLWLFVTLYFFYRLLDGSQKKMKYSFLFWGIGCIVTIVTVHLEGNFLTKENALDGIKLGLLLQFTGVMIASKWLYRIIYLTLKKKNTRYADKINPQTIDPKKTITSG